MTLEEIGEGDGALLCMIEQPDCCQYPYAGAMDDVRGNWYYPNGTRINNTINSSGDSLDFNRTRGQIVVRLNRRQGRVPGIYRCEIPNEMNVTKNIYIGVYNASTGEWHMYIPVTVFILSKREDQYLKDVWNVHLTVYIYQLVDLPLLSGCFGASLSYPHSSKTELPPQ